MKLDLIFTITWIGWMVFAVIIEGIALFNTSRGDTLSEHMWAWLGIRDDFWHLYRTNPDFVSRHGPKPGTPKWTVRLVRTLFIFFLVWFVLHILTGGWV